MRTIESRRRVVRSAAWGAGLALLWLLLAVSRPSLTFHLAPLLVTAAPPVVLGLDDRTGATTREISPATVVGAASALVTTALLEGLGRLDGPGLGPFPDALVESLGLIGLGALIGLGFAGRRRRRGGSPA